MTQRIALDPASAVPIYRQVADALRAAIGSGRLAPDEELPGLRDLAAELRVNYHTIARAYQELEEQGLLVRQRGGPFRVAPGAGGAATASGLRDELRALAARALAEGLDPAAIRPWWSEALDALMSNTSPMQDKEQS